ncbi:cadmium resistance transporter [Saccharopolyspora sp. NPDC000995]|uniref:cadmium resistance transporter n=1 Tax=Saccharopolyspora pogona TaxID=333966 RepID=UPI001684F1BE|nr:cadmium resistance transporter [Saccharopolyspora pogona]
MEGPAGTIITAAGLFAVTNIDGLIVLTALFMASASGLPRPWQIVLGQYLGFTVMVIISVLAAAGLVFVPDRWVGLIGALPLGLGAWGLVRARADPAEETSSWVGTFSSVVGVILANGADNISVYIPLFAVLPPDRIAVTIAVFFVLVGVWCAAARLLGGNKKVVSALVSVGRWLVPVVFMAIGIAILIKTGVVPRLLGFSP